MKIIRHIFLVLFLISFSINSFGQKRQLKKANEYYNNFEYKKAIKYYKIHVEREHDIKAIINLANCYRLTGNTVDAERLYDVIVKSKEALPIHLFYYAEVLKKNEKYIDAKNRYLEYYAAVPEDKNVKELIKSCEIFEEFITDTAMYKVFNLNINTPQSDFAPMFYNKGLVYVSARPQDNKSEKNYGWLDEPFLDIFYSKSGFKDKYREPVNFSSTLNTKYHEGPVVFANNDEVIYFTRSSYLNDKSNSSMDGKNTLNIYKATKKNNVWTEIQIFEFNSDESNIGHPAISRDGKKIFFVSDMPGGFGGTDIYVSQKLGFIWTKPVNLGSEVNTSGNEMFPFVHPDGSLYFSSDGHAGLGGLDIFVSNFNGFRWENPRNLRTPFNSSKDDFSYIINKKNDEGFFASNRDGGKGGDDIYHFIRNTDALNILRGIVINVTNGQPINDVKVVLKDFITSDKLNKSDVDGKFNFLIEPNTDYKIVVSKDGYNTKTVVHYSDENKNVKEPFYQIELESSIWLNLEGKVSDYNSKKPIGQVSIQLENRTYGITKEMITGDDGEFSFGLDPESQYVLVMSKDGYFTEREKLSTIGKLESEIFRFDLFLGLRPITINKSMEVKNIFYELNSWELNRKAKKECDILVDLLKNNPTVSIELQSHTDSRGGDAFNLELSQKRAQSVVDYLVSRGISRSRLVAKGYGETRLKNHCTNGVICPDKLHKQNRRTEFVIIGNQ